MWSTRFLLIVGALFFLYACNAVSPAPATVEPTSASIPPPLVSQPTRVVTAVPSGAFPNSKQFNDPANKFALSVPQSWELARQFNNFLQFTPGSSGIATAQYRGDLTLDSNKDKALAQLEADNKGGLEKMDILVKNYQKGEWDDGVHQGYFAEYDAALNSSVPFDHYLFILLPVSSGGSFQFQFDALQQSSIADAQRAEIKQVTASIQIK